MIPLIILAIEDETSRDFMIRFYEENLTWMYYEARKYFTREVDVEDIVSSAIVKLIDKIDVLQGLDKSKRLPYAGATVRHLALNVLKHENHFQMLSYDALELYLSASENTLAEQKILDEQRRACLHTILNELLVDEWLLLEEKYILLWTDAEIATTLNIQPDSVRMRITRAKRKMVKALNKQDFRLDEWI